MARHTEQLKHQQSELRTQAARLQQEIDTATAERKKAAAQAVLNKSDQLQKRAHQQAQRLDERIEDLQSRLRSVKSTLEALDSEAPSAKTRDQAEARAAAEIEKHGKAIDAEALEVEKLLEQLRKRMVSIRGHASDIRALAITKEPWFAFEGEQLQAAFRATVEHAVQTSHIQSLSNERQRQQRRTAHITAPKRSFADHCRLWAQYLGDDLNDDELPPAA